MLSRLSDLIDGELDCSSLARRLFSQDASLYQQEPLGVVRPSSPDDCKAIVEFAQADRTGLIPRAGGTSLAGQCVGAGLVVDVSRHMTRVLEFDPQNRRARVQPGVVQDDLNDLAASAGLQFAPDTSTSKQAMIGGMMGNNSCGAHSILYGTTRDHIVAINAVLSDGSRATFRSLSPNELDAKLELYSREGEIYRCIYSLIQNQRDQILKGFPNQRVPRRNMGYALDALAQMQPWNPAGPQFSLVPLICGSEGTLCLATEMEVKLVPLPRARSLVCVHFKTIDAACRAVATVLEHRPAAIELLDGILLEATRGNREQAANRFWIEGQPGAVLAVELYGDDARGLREREDRLRNDLRQRGMGYAHPGVEEADMQRVWDLRKAALGVLTGMPGDSRPVTAVEDTAVAPADLARYVERTEQLMKRLDCECVFYGHAGAGLLHLRPMLNLKCADDLAKFRLLLNATADLVAEFKGSLSGEHGDGRLRGRLLKRMLDPEIYAMLNEVKRVFDPNGIMNPGKIIDAPDPADDLRADPQSSTPELNTVLDWSHQQGFVRAVERCNGAGFCRQGSRRGTMCPSYQATLEEAYSTRGRANVMRQLLTARDPEQAWCDPDLVEVMGNCLSCKACASECPSSVDMARMKAEYLQKRHDSEGAGLRERLFGFYTFGARLAGLAPRLASFFINRTIVKRALGVAVERRIPPFAPQTFAGWFSKRDRSGGTGSKKRVVIFNDEFTNYGEPEIGIAAVEVLEACGYDVLLSGHIESGRPLISKGFLWAARQRMSAAVAQLHAYARDGIEIVGLEPSALLGFRDEAPDLVDPELRSSALALKSHCHLFEEFLLREIESGEVDPDSFASLERRILLHGHCHQKALAGMSATTGLLRRIPKADVVEIPSGCCGMAGSFGYEREHYQLSMQIGEMVLFPAVRSEPTAIICASGTSCRQQIEDGTGRKALHPAQILARALKDR